jgi:histidinol dehydrogenase
LLLASSVDFCRSKNKPQVCASFLSVSISVPFNKQQQLLVSIAMAPINGGILNRLSPAEVSLEIKDPVDPKALEQARAILNELLQTENSVNGERLVEVAKRLKDVDTSISSVADLIVSKEVCKQAFDQLSERDKTALVNIHGRIRAFAEMQRKSIVDMEMDIPGGKAGHNVSPCKGS